MYFFVFTCFDEGCDQGHGEDQGKSEAPVVSPNIKRNKNVFFLKKSVYLIVFVVWFSKAGCSSHDHSMLLYTLRGKKEK